MSFSGSISVINCSYSFFCMNNFKKTVPCFLNSEKTSISSSILYFRSAARGMFRVSATRTLLSAIINSFRIEQLSMLPCVPFEILDLYLLLEIWELVWRQGEAKQAHFLQSFHSLPLLLLLKDTVVKPKSRCILFYGTLVVNNHNNFCQFLKTKELQLQKFKVVLRWGPFAALWIAGVD